MTNQVQGPTSAATADETQADVSPPVVKTGFIQRFTVLRSAARELWITFGLKFFAILSWSLMNRTIVFWLQSDVGLSDRKAGLMVSVWSAIMTAVTLLAGSFTDAVGLRRTFLFGAGLCMAARLVMATSVTWPLAILLGLMPVAVGEALLGPVMVAATKRYATTAQRSISFSIVYAIMNLSFLVAGNTFDYVRRHFGEHGHHVIIGRTFSTYEVLILLSIAAMTPVLVLSLLLRKNVEVTDQGVTFTDEAAGVSVRPGAGVIEMLRTAFSETFRIFGGLRKQPGFFRFLVFLFFATFMRMIFFHTSYTLAPMGVRELGDGAPVGQLDTINNWMIIFLVPVVGALTQRVSAYKMVVFGSLLGTASVFILALPVHIYEPLAQGWLGNLIAHGWLGVEGAVNPWYVSIALFYVAISFGEAFYSPRLYEYAAVIAPKGQEASYMAMSYMPFFLAKLSVGTLSGVLLERYCPRQGAHHSEMIWWIIGATTAIAPVGLIVFRRYIQVGEAGRDG